jgi:aminopeptidase
MADPRIAKLARVLVRYSLGLHEGDLLFTRTTPLAAPLVRELYREALAVGAHLYTRIILEEAEEAFYKYASDAQLDYVSPLLRGEYEHPRALLAIDAEQNRKNLSGIAPARISRRLSATQEMNRIIYTREMAGEMVWTRTQFPTEAAAQDADMSLADYEDFVYGAGKLGEDDPVAAWQTVQREQQRIADILNTKRVIRLVSPDTDLTYETAGRAWINASGTRNFPDGEVFTSPDETKTEGHVRFTYPAVYLGREVEDVRLIFHEGRVVEATAGKGQDYLETLLSSDEGARRLGEAAFGLNYDIARFTRYILFDEKIGGTIHLALGESFPQIGGQNHSAIHWDMICDMRAGEAYADGELVYKHGRFVM